MHSVPRLMVFTFVRDVEKISTELQGGWRGSYGPSRFSERQEKVGECYLLLHSYLRNISQHLFSNYVAFTRLSPALWVYEKYEPLFLMGPSTWKMMHLFSGEIFFSEVCWWELTWNWNIKSPCLQITMVMKMWLTIVFTSLHIVLIFSV